MIKYTFHCQYSQNLNFKIKGKQLIDYINALPLAEVKISSDGYSKISLRCLKSYATIPLIHDNHYSELVTVDKPNRLVVQGKYLEKWVNCIKDFVLVDDNRFFATGALVWIEQGETVKLHAVASDMKRLVKVALINDFNVQKKDDLTTIIPKKTLDEMKRYASENLGENLTIEFDGEELYLKGPQYVLRSCCLVGDYPPWEGAVPKIENYKIEVERSLFVDSIKRANMFLDEKKSITVVIDNKKMGIYGNLNLEQENESLELMNSNLDSLLKVHYNGSLLNSILNAIECEKITMVWDEMQRPVKLYGDKIEGLDVYYLLVPVRH